MIRNPSNNKVQTGKAIVLFTFLSFLPAALGFFLLPVYLKYYEPGAYGALTLLNLISGFYVAIGTLKLDAAARTNYYDYKHDPAQLKMYVSSIFTYSLILAFAFYFVFLVVAYVLLEYNYQDIGLSFYPYGLVVVTSGLFSLMLVVYFIVLKNEYRLREFAAYSIAIVSLSFCLQYVLIAIVKMGILGALLGVMIAKGIVAISLLINRRDLINLKPERSMLRASLKFSIPFLPFIIINWFFLNGDRFLLEHLLSINELGLYALLLNVLGLIKVFFHALDGAFRPYLFNLFSNNSPEIFSKTKQVANWYFVLGMLAISGIILVGSNLNFITDNTRYLTVIPLFTLGGLVMMPQMFIRIPALILVYSKDSKFISYASFISLILIVVLFFMLIPKFQLYGALYALGIMNLFLLILFYFQAQRAKKLDYNLPAILSCSFVAWIVIGGLFYFRQELDWSYNVYGIVQFAGTFLVVALFGFLNKLHKR